MCEQQKNKPHVHAELIKAWADGAIIERYNPYKQCWYVCYPLWEPDEAFRIQPPKKSPGQIAEEAYYKAACCTPGWQHLPADLKKYWEAAAQAVIDSLKQK